MRGGFGPNAVVRILIRDRAALDRVTTEAETLKLLRQTLQDA